MNETVQNAINEQIKNELYSAYIYLSMSAYFEAADFPGMAAWMRAQSQEEVEHAMKFFSYMHDRSGRVELHAIDKPQKDWESPLDAFRTALEHEQFVTGLIHSLYETAVQEKDYPTQSMLQWFIDEQVEEEATAGEIVAYLEKASGNIGALMMLDARLGSRQQGPAE
jgi:ferritin